MYRLCFIIERLLAPGIICHRHPFLCRQSRGLLSFNFHCKWGISENFYSISLTNGPGSRHCLPFHLGVKKALKNFVILKKLLLLKVLDEVLIVNTIGYSGVSDTIGNMQYSRRRTLVSEPDEQETHGNPPAYFARCLSYDNRTFFRSSAGNTLAMEKGRLTWAGIRFTIALPW